MDRYVWHQTALTALHGGLYLAIIIDRYGWPQIDLTIALHGGLYLAIIMDGYGVPQTPLTKALLEDLYLAIII
jgi:hypothetical protein